MHCTTTKQRIVAFQDAELSPGEHTRVQEHLAVCSDCQNDEKRLDRVGPLRLDIPLPAYQAMHEVTDPDLVWHLASTRPLGTDSAPWDGWLTQHVEVPNWWLVAAAALLATTIGWAVSTSASLGEANAELASRATSAPTAIVSPGAEVPADQFRAASWRASDDPVYH